MNASDRLQEFIQGIQNYIEGKNLGPTKFNKDYRIAETYSTEKLEKLTQDECFNGAFLLYQYADYINSEKASQEVVFNWCDKALNIINDFTNAPQTLYDEWLKGEREDYKQDLLKNPVLFNKETYPFSDAIKYQPRYNN